MPGSSNEIMSSKYRPEVGQDHGRAGGWRLEAGAQKEGRKGHADLLSVSLWHGRQRWVAG